MTTDKSPQPKKKNDSAQRDAERLRHHYPLNFLFKILGLLLVLFLIMCIVLYVMAGTSRGTKFIVEKIISETGIKFEYGEGNLRDGLVIKDISMSASEDVDIHFINTYVQIGWRAMFTKEVHFRNAQIGSIIIDNHLPPTGDPFEYTTYELPVNLRFDNASINKIVYKQKGEEPIEVTDIQAKDLIWVGTRLDVGKANLQYNDLVKISELKGVINLEDDYPLQMSADVSIHDFDQVYIDTLQVNANGSLKRTYGDVKSKYNDSKVKGEFTIQGMDDNVPFDAKLTWDDVTLPYAESQEIRLRQGLATASGVLSDFELRINSRLLANDIPSGRYKGRAKIIDTDEMRVERLTATTADGDLLAKGVIDWKEVFNIKAMLYSQDYKVATLLPVDFAPYAPKVFNGKLAFVYNNENKDGLMQIDASLLQQDGERITAQLVKGEQPKNPRFSAPWYIDANWQNLVRRNIADVGNLISPYGKANVELRDDRLWVKADAQIDELNVAPTGNYKVRLSKVNDEINFRSFNYQGVMGDLEGKGTLVLANKNKPLTWQLDAKTKGLNPQVINKDIAVTNLVGSLQANGQMIDIVRRSKGRAKAGLRHLFSIESTDLKATLMADVDVQSAQASNTTKEKRQIRVLGKGDGRVDMLGSDIDHFDARFAGQVATQGLPEGHFDIDANGTLNAINIKSLSHKGEAGELLASGTVNLTDGIQWNISAKGKEVNVGYFSATTQGVVSGDLKTSGHWRDNQTKVGDLKAFDVQFDGQIDTSQLPQGRLVLDAAGNGQSVNLRRLSLISKAGGLFAKGDLDVNNGVTWDIDAVMDNFNLGYFIEDMPSSLTGQVFTTGTWKDKVQRIDIEQIALDGQLKGEALSARGSLNTTLHLPQDMAKYLEVFKGADSNEQMKKFNSIVEKIDANNLSMQWGANQLMVNGNAQNLQAKMNVEDFSVLGNGFSGNALGAITLIQPTGQALPTLYIDLKSDELGLPGVELEKGVIKGKVVDLAKSPSILEVTAEGLQAADNRFENLYATFKGTENKHVLRLKADTTSIDTGVSIEATLSGGFNRKQQSWKGVIGNGEIRNQYATLTQSQPAQLLASFAEDNPKVNLAAHCWQADSKAGKICLRENLLASTERGQVNLALQQINTSLLIPFLPKEVSWKANLNGKAVMQWGKGIEPIINATLYSDNGKIGMVQDGYSEPVTLPYKRVSLIIRSINEGVKVRTDIDSGHGARGYADVVIDPFKENKPISGALVLNEFNLAILKPFFPGMRQLSGDITMAGGVGGTLSSPVFYGDVNLKDAKLAMLELPVNLTNINATAKIRGQNATIDGEFMSGEGTGVLSGTVNWQQEMQAKIRLQGERLVLSQPPLLFAEVSPDFSIIIKPQRQLVNIVGAVSVPTATLRPPESNQDVIAKSNDVVVIDRDLIGNLDEVLAISKPWSINADIGVDLGSNVNFRGFGAVIPLAGAVHITQTDKSGMQGLGVVQVSRRTDIDAFGQSLELNYGQIRFNGDIINPMLSIEAAKEIEGNTVGLRVKGRISDPNIVVFNNAGLTQQQAMNALVTGRITNPGATQISEEGFKSEVTNNLAAAGLSFGLMGTRGLTNSIGQAFGLERLTIDATGNSDDTNVNLTGYITPDLYIRYGVGVFNAQSSLSLRYQLTRRIYVEATSSIENAVDVVYSFQF